MVPQVRELTLQRILDFVDEHYSEPISPRDVAAAMHYSLCHLTHVTRRTLGAPVSELIFQRRLLAAQRLLEETALPVSAIAARVGLHGLAYFSRRFSKATGASPTQWRKARRESQASPRCHTCGTEMAAPLIPLAKNDTPQVRAAAAQAQFEKAAGAPKHQQV